MTFKLSNRNPKYIMLFLVYFSFHSTKIHLVTFIIHENHLIYTKIRVKPLLSKMPLSTLILLCYSLPQPLVRNSGDNSANTLSIFNKFIVLFPQKVTFKCMQLLKSWPTAIISNIFILPLYFNYTAIDYIYHI